MKAYPSVLLFAVLLQSFAVYAYIPRSRMILEKTARNDGRGVYVIEQEVQFQTEPENITARETWTIQDGENMQVTVRIMGATGPTAKPLAIVYRPGQRYTVETGGRVDNMRMPSDVLEPYFHFRSADGLGRFLTSNRLISSSLVADRKVSNLKNLKFEADPNIQLARVGNVVTFAMGLIRSGQLVPSVWIDQERFVIKKLKFPSGAEVLADNGEQFAKGLIFPKDRTVSWDDKVVQLRTISVKALGDHDMGSKLNPQVVAGEEKLNGLMPAPSVVREFYSRFR